MDTARAQTEPLYVEPILFRGQTLPPSSPPTRSPVLRLRDWQAGAQREACRSEPRPAALPARGSYRCPHRPQATVQVLQPPANESFASRPPVKNHCSITFELSRARKRAKPAAARRVQLKG